MYCTKHGQFDNWDHCPACVEAKKLDDLDNMLVVSHLGTLQSFPTIAHAVRALVDFDLSVERYFDGERVKELEKLLEKVLGHLYNTTVLREEIDTVLEKGP